MEDLGPQMLPTLRKLSLDDVIRIWAAMSEYTQQTLLMNQAVRIPGIGTFLVVEQQILDVGYSDVTVARPVFLLSETLADVHGLIFTQDNIPDDSAIAKLNYLQIATETDFPQRTVKGCVKEIAFSFCSCLAKRHNAELVFQDLGILVVQGKELQMRFYQNFLKSLDWTGKLLQTFLREVQVSLASPPHMEAGLCI
ncbi:coiled-coil domain-containing protein 81-like [Rhea pennata]|uniref:coiled-coil domain-containing protein 81-like n=1 Tax=Rhea pennata TaxID=8795 RepID=UPI002E256DD9